MDNIVSEINKLMMHSNLFYNQSKRSFEFTFLQPENALFTRKLLDHVTMKEVKPFVMFVHHLFPNFHNPDYNPVTHMQLTKLYDKHFNCPLGIKKIKIEHPVDFVFVERTVGDYAMRGSRFYCGHCGEVICRATEVITMPVWMEQLRPKVTDIKFAAFPDPERKHHTLVQCLLCNTVMFKQSPGMMMASLKDYFTALID